MSGQSRELNLDSWGEAHREAYRRAVAHLAERRPEAVASLVGGCWVADTGELHLPFLGQQLRVKWRQGDVLLGGRPAPLAVSIIVLHHLLESTGAEVQGRWITFKEISGGSVYYPTYRARTIEPLVREFGRCPQRLLPAAVPLGGVELAGVGRVGVLLQVFPRFPLGIGLWPGDEEVPPSGTILYDVTAPGHLPTEDIVVVTELVVRKLLQCGGKGRVGEKR